MFAKLGAASISATKDDADLDDAAALSRGWKKLAASVGEAGRLARPDRVDCPFYGVLPRRGRHVLAVLTDLGSAVQLPR